MNAHEPVSHRDALDIVFANRNRAYGAYQLRRQYPATLGKAFGAGILIIGLLLLMPRIVAAFANILPEKPVAESDRVFKVIKIELPPPIKLVTPPPPPKVAIAFTPPIVAPDDKTPETPQTEVQTLLDDPREVGAKTVDGPPEGPPTLDPPVLGNGVIETPAPPADETLEPFAVNKMPSFPGGEAEMFRWLYKHIQYPEMAKEAGVQGPVVLSFVVGKDGNIGEIAILKTPSGGASLGKEASRVVQAMPRWLPGEANGHPVKVRYTLPLRFELK